MISVVTITPLLTKIKSIAHDLDVTSDLKEGVDEKVDITAYLKVLQGVQQQICRYKDVQQDYRSLETQIQKVEKMLRSKIGTQQQMKLYTQSLKNHIQQLSLQKLQLLQASKLTIKELKRVNQQLYIQMHTKSTTSNRKERVSSALLSQHKHSSVKRDGSDKKIEGFSSRSDIKQIVKTEHIDQTYRNIHQSHTKTRKTKPASGTFKINQDKTFNIKQNSKTFQVNEAKTDRQYLTSKKKQSNQVYPYLKPMKKKDEVIKNSYFANNNNNVNNNRQSKKQKTKMKNVNRSLWREKMANKSVASINSMEAVSSQKQQTI